MVETEAALLDRFVAAFKRGIEREVAAMQGSSDAFELTLGRGDELGGLRYSFELPDASDKLAAGAVHTVTTLRGPARITVERCDELRVTVVSDQAIDLAARPIALVVAPWFLYERLIQALDELRVDERSAAGEAGRNPHGVALALTLFGKRPHRRTPRALRCDHSALNASQRAAVQLCSDGELAFVWGPPGTGKTATLTHVVEELLAHDQRILLVSTTNAAIDQVLAKLAAQPWFTPAVAAGSFVRLGTSDQDTFGTELAEVVRRRQGGHRTSLDHHRARIAEIELQLRHAAALIAELAAAVAPQQSLFAAPPVRLRPAQLAGVFPPGLADAIAGMPPANQARALELRLARLTRLRALLRERVAHHMAAVRDTEAQVMASARLVLCTLSNAYLSPLMKPQRFDVLIAEEAGMAALPALFYAACLCTAKAIMVGDPRQLPPIVHARDERVQRAIGRSVFEVTIPDPARSDVVAMLEIQYRMHPAIGALVGRLFYGGRLVHQADAARVAAIAGRAPYRGMPVVVVDTAGQTRCERSAKGASRINPASAELTAELALEAVNDGAADIAVITPYAAQAGEIRRRLAARRIADAVECSTIHRFQGRECDVVIIDLVDAPPMRPGLLLAGGSDASNLLNVSISRARGKLVLVADVGYFETNTPDGVVTAILREAISGGARVGRTAVTAAAR